MVLRVAFTLLSALLALPGCVSKKYQLAPNRAAPVSLIDLAARQLPLAAVLHTVIVNRGPGSWKRDAYWDEYVVSFVNQGQAPITIDSALLAASFDASRTVGTDPWKLEKQSHKILKDSNHLGREVVAGAGVAVLLTASYVGIAAASLGATTGAVAAASAATFVAVPVWLITAEIRTHNARRAIVREFGKRRIALPLQLQPGVTRQGSLFFPISPGPLRLELHIHSEGVAQLVSIDLTPITDLHLTR